MRTIWEGLYRSLMRSICEVQAVEQFRRARQDYRELADYDSPIEVVDYLHGEGRILAEKDAVVASLVALSQGEAYRDLGLHTLLVALWPGLDAAFRRRARRGLDEQAELVSTFYDRFVGQARGLRLERVSRVAPTLVWNTEREVGQVLDRLRPRGSCHELCAEDGAGEDSFFGVMRGARVDDQVVTLRHRLTKVRDCDLDLVLAVAVEGHSQQEAAVLFGISHEAARKRMQRSRRAIHAHFFGDFEDTQKSSPSVSRTGGPKCIWLDVRGEPTEECAPSEAWRDEMGPNMWKQTEDMAKQHDQSGSDWLKLPNDGDKAVVVFLGQPFPREVCFVDGKFAAVTDALKAQGIKPSLRVALNVALFDSREVKVLEQGVRFFKDLVRVRDKYTLEKWAFEIQRHGAAKDPNTTYSILPEHQLSAEQMAAFQSLKTHDLQRLYEAGASESASGPEPLIDSQTAVAIATTLKSLPREAVDQFCNALGVQRIKELRASQVARAKVFVEALVNEFSPDSQVDPFA